MRSQPALYFGVDTVEGPLRARFRLASRRGVGFCIVLPDDKAMIQKAREICEAEDIETTHMGEVIDDPAKKVILEPKNLVGQGESFTKSS